MNNSSRIWDSPDGYGLVSRLLHWLMAALFVWQFISTILRVTVKDTPIYNSVWPTHYQLGFALLLLVALRGVWGLLNVSRRPHKAGLIGKLAALGHVVLYALMFTVPVLALLRAYGSGRGFSFLGIEVFAQTGIQNPQLIAPGSAFHGLLGWTLLAVIVGHVVMALVHHFVLRDNTLRQMTSRR